MKNAAFSPARPLRKNISRSVPMGNQVEAAPNAMPNPKTAKAIVEKQKSSMFFCATLMAFLVRTEPASISMKPICIIRTKVAAVRTQKVSIVATRLSISGFATNAR